MILGGHLLPEAKIHVIYVDLKFRAWLKVTPKVRTRVGLLTIAFVMAVVT